MRRRRRVMKSNAGFLRWVRAALVALPALLFLAGCGGSGTIVAGGGTGGTGISAGVITEKGSVTVNDVRFAVDNTTSIRLNDLPASESDLQIGMIVKLRGTFNAGGTTGTAESIEAESNVKGRISLFGPEQDSFSVLGQKTFVDNQTKFAGVGGLGDLRLNDVVRVFGFRDVQGDIWATFVERLAGSGEEEEISGIVSEKNVIDNTFVLGGFLLVDFVARNPEIEPPGFGFENGDPVEVEGVFNVGTNRFEATEIEREDIEDAEFDPLEDDRVEVEGFASDVTEIAPGIFTLSVNGVPVRTNADTSYEGGVRADLRDNVRVEAEGVWTMIGVDLVLVAENIEFE
jgi:hypothetical protein